MLCRITAWHQSPCQFRLQVLCHELTHAWLHTVGRPHSHEECLCDFAGAVACQLALDVQRQPDEFRVFVAG